MKLLRELYFQVQESNFRFNKFSNIEKSDTNSFGIHGCHSIFFELGGYFFTLIKQLATSEENYRVKIKFNIRVCILFIKLQSNYLSINIQKNLYFAKL